MEIVLANPRGFCAGVDRAIDILEIATEIYPQGLYVKHDIVHNKTIIEYFQSKGVHFIEDLELVPVGGVLIFSAHGVSQEVVNIADQRNLTVFDATCPLVLKVHMQVRKYSQTESDCILIGHKNHPEVEGTLGQYQGKIGKMYLVQNQSEALSIKVAQPDNLGLVTQTTLSLDDTTEIIDILKNRFPNIKLAAKKDICYATQNRQDAVRHLSEVSDLILVLGSSHSSNSNRLVELAIEQGVTAYLIDNAGDIDLSLLNGVKKLGITSGASAPEKLVVETIDYIKEHFKTVKVEELEGIKEDIYFKLPANLVAAKSQVIARN